MSAVAIAENPRAVIGGNSPPPSPYELASKAVEDAYGEASLWLDGAAVDSQELADGIANLLKVLRDARKLADDTRKIEAKPFDDGKAEVQQRYNPLLAKADLAAAACKKALEPWLTKLAAELAAKAKRERDEAAEKRRLAEDAIRAADVTNLEARAVAEALLKSAKKAEAVASRAEKQTATAGGANGRVTSLRAFYVPTVTDPVALARWAWATHREALQSFLVDLVCREVQHGKRDIPGVEIIEEKRAV